MPSISIFFRQSNNGLVAGSETTATLLAGVTYYMLRNPDILDKAVEEVRSAFAKEEDISFTSASAQLPYMLACLEEGLRTYPPVPTILIRTTPLTETSTIDGYTVPAGTDVGVHQMSTNYSSQNFKDPESFVPERWLPEAINDSTSPYYDDNRDARQPFSVGPRNCIGIALAWRFRVVANLLQERIWLFRKCDKY